MRRGLWYGFCGGALHTPDSHRFGRAHAMRPYEHRSRMASRRCLRPWFANLYLIWLAEARSGDRSQGSFFFHRNDTQEIVEPGAWLKGHSFSG